MKKIISKKSLFDLFDYIFNDDAPTVYTHCSELCEDILVFRNSNDLKEYVNTNMSKNFFGFAVYYSDMSGYIENSRIDIDPKIYKKPAFRYEVTGWGLIYLYCNFNSLSEVECEISVNSMKRAELWSNTISDLKDPALWNWSEVQKKSNRIIRFLKKLV